MDQTAVVTGLEELSRDQCLDLLATVPVGRVGVSVNALPVVLPVNFALLDGDIVFRTARGTKFDAAVAHAVVAFEADAYGANGRRGWSVMVQGTSSELTDPAVLERAHALELAPWGVGAGADRFVRVESRFVSGRRFGSHS
jgi:nitroimidazol reductase NimA-like FMN-containing flavoprotein (pyridoxamine 5'-phosphate oxidase superfamily)